MGKSPRETTAHIDIAIGARLRTLRLKTGMTQEELGEQIGVTYQQIQKYEIGRNRIPASRLWAIAQTMGLPIHAFFQLQNEIPEE